MLIGCGLHNLKILHLCIFCRNNVENNSLTNATDALSNLQVHYANTTIYI